MSKPTLDEVIKHEKREAEYQRNIARQLEENGEHPFYIRSNYKSAEYHEQIAGLLEELKQYKDAEEQGTLMKLPCKPEDTVYVIADNKKIYPLMAKNEISIIHGELHILCESHCYSDLCCYNDLNKKLFLTLEEANKALERIKKCCGTCLYFCGEVGDEEQFCDEKEIYVSEKNWCCKYKSINEE